MITQKAEHLGTLFLLFIGRILIMATRGVTLMNFWGQRDRPLTPLEIARKDPILAQAKPPAEFLDLASRRSLYVSAPVGKQPTTHLVKVDENRDRTLWQLTIANHAGQQVIAMPGKTAKREKPADIAGAIDPSVSITGKRPDWLHQLYQPRLVPKAGVRLRRFNGRHVTPTYVFGPDSRQPYQDTSYPWGCVGKVYNSEGKVGSGALVFGDIMVTAGHVVPWNDVNNHNWWMRFRSRLF
jgi:hypothetical protein